MDKIIFLLACIIVFGFRVMIGQGKDIVDVDALLAMSIGGFVVLSIAYGVKHWILKL